ncbi:MAG: amidohydrolase family protein [Phycisphaerae bacterium]
MEITVQLNDLDRQIWEEELAEFVPSRIFDAHTHLYDFRPEISAAVEPVATYGTLWLDYPLSTWSMLGQVDQLLLPGRQVHRIAFGNPLQKSSLEQANAFTAQQVLADPQSIALMLTRPSLSPREMIDQIRKYHFQGLKPYRTHAVTGDSVECRITDFLPEEQIEIADQLHLMVMLHLSKRKAIADPDNLNDLERLATKYPHVQWVLAHCARSYYDRPLIQAANRLRAIPNLWYEISSVCDADAMAELLSIGGPDRVMYGSDDIPVGILRGKYITFGHGWAGMTDTNHQFDLSHCDPRMTFTRYESLRAFRRATSRHGYGKTELEKLFFTNAMNLISSRQSGLG